MPNERVPKQIMVERGGKVYRLIADRWVLDMSGPEITFWFKGEVVAQFKDFDMFQVEAVLR